MWAVMWWVRCYLVAVISSEDGGHDGDDNNGGSEDGGDDGDSGGGGSVRPPRQRLHKIKRWVAMAAQMIMVVI